MSTYIQMLNTIVGSGILTFPSMMQRIGLVAGNS
jgi:amino acid permease